MQSTRGGMTVQDGSFFRANHRISLTLVHIGHMASRGGLGEEANESLDLTLDIYIHRDTGRRGTKDETVEAVCDRACCCMLVVYMR